MPASPLKGATTSGKANAPAAAAPAPVVQQKKKKKKLNERHVFITERRRYLNHAVPSVDTVIEEDKLVKKLAHARETQDWKEEAQALLQLGQLMKWKAKEEIGDDYLAQAASVLRHHTFEVDDDADVDAGSWSAT